MGPSKRILIAMILVFASLAFISGCGSRTQVRYIVPAGYAVMEQDESQNTQAATSNPVSVTIKDEDDSDNGPSDSGQSQAGGDKNSTIGNTTIDYSTVVSAPAGSEVDSYTTKDAAIDELQAKICSDNDVILGYVGCYYDEKKENAKLTIKNSGRGDIKSMWFYIKVADKTGYAKSDGFEPGYINDYVLPVAEWTKRYGIIQRILVTPVIEEKGVLYACNNRQLLLLHEVNCREMVS